MNRFVAALAIAAVFWSESLAAATPESPPVGLSGRSAPSHSDALAPVTLLHDTLIEVMKDADALGFEGRRQTLGPVLRTIFNFPAMAQAAVGQYWGQMNEVERQELLEVFEEFSVATYADRFNRYAGQRFETLGEKPAPRSAVWVRTRLVIPADAEHPEGRTVNLNYLVRDFGTEGWRIIDVFLGGAVSEMATRRSEYTSVIRREGVAALIETLASKARALN